MNSESYALSEGFASSVQRKKRLGQVYSGSKVSKFLSILAKSKKAKSIIDPMAGTGDLLVACKETNQTASLNAIEIDTLAYTNLKNRLPNTLAINGNAFDLDVISSLDFDDYELVITNPPYVRYQELKKGAGKKSVLDSSQEIREKLLNIVSSRTNLNSETRLLMNTLIQEYSGLSDLAVPSLILTCLLCKPCGQIAVVLPDSWITRNYAGVIHYLLLRLFRIEYIVEDLNSAWFDDAQVKGSLLVATKKNKITSLSDFEEYKFKYISLPKAAMSNTDLVGNLYPNCENPSLSFISDINANLRYPSIDGLTVVEKSIENEIAKLVSKHQNSKWFLELEKDSPMFKHESHPKQSLQCFLDNYARNKNLVSLEDLGVSIGQGLRTGANEFFYADMLKENKDNVLIKLSKRMGEKEIIVPKELIRPAIRYQTELSDSLCISSEHLKSALIYIQDSVTKKDFEEARAFGFNNYSILPTKLELLISRAEETVFGQKNAPKKITELSAVKPNIRKGCNIKNLPPRFWYMLPKLATRHLPDLVIPRVNNSSPSAFLCQNNEVVVDANFSTLTIKNSKHINKYSLFAILNSNWVKAYMELNCSVMGGGALKVEASHIKKTPVPCFNKSQLSLLDRLGRELLQQNRIDIILEIDHLILKAVYNQNIHKETVDELVNIVSNRRNARKIK